MLSGCGARRSAPTGVIRYPLQAEPSSLDFTRVRDKPALALGRLVGDTLATYDRNLVLHPRLAHAWEWSPDHLRLTFALRQDARWHDGRKVTAADVLHTFERVTDPQTGLPDRVQMFNLVERLETPNPSTVRVHYKRPYAPALVAWSQAPIVPRHRPAGDPVGCGPFRLERWERGQRIVLLPDPDHYAGAPNVREFRLEVLTDAATRFAALRSGALDLCPVVADQYLQYEADPELRRRFRPETYHVLFFQYVAWRMDGSNPFFGDRRVRRAMTHAIDRETYVRVLQRGFGTVPVTSLHPDTWGHAPGLAPWPFDPARSRALLAEAGWRPGAGGVLVRGGVPFRFRLTYAATNAETARIAEYIAAALANVGVAAELEPLDWGVFQDRVAARRFEALLFFRYLDPDPDPFDLWHSSQAQTGVNYAGLRDPEVDHWIERAREDLDTARRADFYARIERRLHEEQPDTFLSCPEARCLVDVRLRGVSGSPLGMFEHWPGPAAWTWSAESGGAS